jgi:hypothetical protein
MHTPNSVSLKPAAAQNLEGATYSNNAFVMKVGRLLIVEFGETGNAAYLFDAHNPPFQLQGALHLRDHLKNRRNLGNLKHVDGREKWEVIFRQAIKDHTGLIGMGVGDGVKPSQNERKQRETTHKPGGVFAPLDFEKAFRAFCAERGLRFHDRRLMGGKLVVYASADNPKISGTLGQWGFTFDRSIGAWMKEA